MKWATWQDIGVDRMACIWLIQRHIDPAAEFVFFPSQSSAPADAEPFDIPGVRFTHRRGHATFHALVADHTLNDPVLARIAAIVDEADIIQPVTVEPAAPGLDLLCRGLRRISGDDSEAARRGCQLFDALYAQLRAESKGEAL